MYVCIYVCMYIHPRDRVDRILTRTEKSACASYLTIIPIMEFN